MHDILLNLGLQAHSLCFCLCDGFSYLWTLSPSNDLWLVVHSITSTRTLLSISKMLMIGEKTFVLLHLTLLTLSSVISVNNLLLGVVVHVVSGFLSVVSNGMPLRF
jgi:hypothetical protein